MRNLIFILATFGLLVLVSRSFPETPQISLPEAAHHNTIGELPFVEVMDDGDFYEVDGAEEKGRKDRLREYQYKLESKYRDCLDRITKKCGEGSNDKYVRNYYRHLPTSVREPNPAYKHLPKQDKCRIKKADKCHNTLTKKAKRAGYWFHPTSGYFYFQAHGDKSDEEWISDTNSYMGTYVWVEKESKEVAGNGGNFK